MSANPPWKAKKREGADSPSFGTLGESMSQGAKYSRGAVTHGLDAQMGQGSKGYSHARPANGKKGMLRDDMQQ
jgi:hypothetical protein